MEKHSFCRWNGVIRIIDATSHDVKRCEKTAEQNTNLYEIKMQKWNEINLIRWNEETLKHKWCKNGLTNRKQGRIITSSTERRAVAFTGAYAEAFANGVSLSFSSSSKKRPIRSVAFLWFTFGCALPSPWPASPRRESPEKRCRIRQI